MSTQRASPQDQSGLTTTEKEFTLPDIVGYKSTMYCTSSTRLKDINIGISTSPEESRHKELTSNHVSPRRMRLGTRRTIPTITSLTGEDWAPRNSIQPPKTLAQSRDPINLSGPVGAELFMYPIAVR
ncbi:hypothetical protein GIB67_022537 [Kingdonia uniflora]|uniref:Uncharacterized protein n=1 Tax=Kingdonia uniflora TaxID=39325 RepID=A0A7J7L7D7_9MAGN|nr:hypothetical protein GIB67_022537 [Kingdonia uniflora]